MKKLRILFMGTPEFSVPMLNAIFESEHELTGVVTAVDKPAGRGRKMTKSAVKEYAESKGIKILQPKNMKSAEFFSQLQDLNPNVIVVVAFRMLPKQVWDYPEYGTFNLHASLLPQYRGAAPINWAIINGEIKTGLTTFFIDEKIDTGEIIEKVEVDIKSTDNVEDLYHKMLPKGVELVLGTLKAIAENTIKTTQQKTTGKLKSAPKLSPENTRILWNNTGETINDLVRGLSPYPLAWTTLLNGEDKMRCNVSKVRFQKESHDKAFGEIVQKNKSLFVAVEDGWIELLEVKLAGKRLMNTKDLLNGFTLKNPCKLI